ncbi:hypothetical protein ACVOMV_15565 [Mesorhizobium atlanticum]
MTASARKQGEVAGQAVRRLRRYLPGTDGLRLLGRPLDAIGWIGAVAGSRRRGWPEAEIVEAGRFRRGLGHVVARWHVAEAERVRSAGGGLVVRGRRRHRIEAERVVERRRAAPVRSAIVSPGHRLLERIGQPGRARPLRLLLDLCREEIVAADARRRSWPWRLPGRRRVVGDRRLADRGVASAGLRTST